MARIVKPLTATEINNAKHKDKEYSIADGNGLFLVITKISKIWRFQYYKPFSKKRTIISLGSYPELSLSAARQKRDEYRSLLMQNIDPKDYVFEESQKKLQEKEFTLTSMAKSWLKLRENEVKAGKLKQDTFDDIKDRLQRHLLDVVGHYSIYDISAPLMISKLRGLEKEGKLDTLHRIIGYLNNIMIHAVNSSIIPSNPTADIGKVFIKPVHDNNPSILFDELPEFFETLRNSKITLETRCAIELILLTAMRVGSIVQMEWSEIDWKNELWEVPKHKMKGRIGKVQDFICPLSKQSIAILKTMKKISGHRQYVFPGVQNVHEHMSRDTPNKAIKRIGYQNKLTAHGLRSVFSTEMNEREFNADIIEVCLAHFEYSTVRGTYNKAKYLTQRKEYMQKWGDLVEKQSRGNAMFDE
ncbi:TPA: tyrosine-type recombinase/integrase [Pasteurella multocida]|nr:tyrosine-type recombinase/integrase [Pasteurella multocida]